MEHQLKIETTDRDPFAVIRLEGALAGATVYELKHEGNRLIDYMGRNYIVLDMTGITFVDSGGIGVIMHLFKTCKQMGGRMNAVNPAAATGLNALYQASLQKFIDFHADAPTALGKLCEKCGLTPPKDLHFDAIPVERALIADERLQKLEARVARLEALLERETRGGAAEMTA